MILLDTNVLVYALGRPHPLREPSRRVLDAVSKGRVEAGTIDTVVIEFLHVFSRRRSKASAASAARDYVELLGPLVEVTAKDVALGVDIFENHELGSADALVAAVAANHDAEALVTADRSFEGVPGILVLDPRSPELERLLSA